MPHQVERNSVEDYLVEKLQEKGWKVVDAKTLVRESYEEPLLLKNLIECIKKIDSQKGIGLSDVDIKQVLNELNLRATGIEGQKQILRTKDQQSATIAGDLWNNYIGQVLLGNPMVAL